MSSKYCLRKEAALSENLKKSVITSEVHRRLLNTREVKEQDIARVNCMESFTRRMTVSGYTKKDVVDVMECVILGYERKLAQSVSEGRSIHRDGSQGVMSRRIRKVAEKGN